VKVVWTREDDIRFDYFHTVDAMYLKAGLDSHGKPSAWLQRTVFPSIDSTFALASNTAAPANSAWASPTCLSTFPTSAPKTARP
jgi:hypothetical protein